VREAGSPAPEDLSELRRTDRSDGKSVNTEG